MTTQNWSEDPIVLGTPPHETTSPDAGQSTPSQAKGEAKDLAKDGAGAAKDVAQTASSEAKKVAGEASTQAKNLLGELGSDLKSQAGEQQQKVTEGLRSLSDELKSMAEKSEEGGPAKQLVQQAADRTGSAAGWLEGRDPGTLLDDVKGFARSKPGTFLILAAGAGLLAGRLTRGLTGSQDSGTDISASGSGNGQPQTTIYPPVEHTRAPAHAAPTSGAPVLDPSTKPAQTYPATPAITPATPSTDELPGRREIR